jgi:hypothetical protein
VRTAASHLCPADARIVTGEASALIAVRKQQGNNRHEITGCASKRRNVCEGLRPPPDAALPMGVLGLVQDLREDRVSYCFFRTFSHKPGSEKAQSSLKWTQEVRERRESKRQSEGLVLMLLNNHAASATPPPVWTSLTIFQTFGKWNSDELGPEAALPGGRMATSRSAKPTLETIAIDERSTMLDQPFSIASRTLEASLLIPAYCSAYKDQRFQSPSGRQPRLPLPQPRPGAAACSSVTYADEP